MQDNTIEELREAAPVGGAFDAQKKPSTKALEALKEWRDKEARDQFEKELLDAIVMKLEDEVK